MRLKQKLRLTFFRENRPKLFYKTLLQTEKVTNLQNFSLYPNFKLLIQNRQWRSGGLCIRGHTWLGIQRRSERRGSLSRPFPPPLPVRPVTAVIRRELLLKRRVHSGHWAAIQNYPTQHGDRCPPGQTTHSGLFVCLE